jgi:hypothetical protein
MMQARTTPRIVFAALAAFAFAGWSLDAAAQTPRRPDQAFQSLRALVGEWQGRAGNGRSVLVSYRLIANDTVLVETWTMSPTRTSMTVYHMDGDNLLATHYCPQGNQPRLQYQPELSGDRLEFRFRDSTNLPDANAAHQHAFWVRVDGSETFTRDETYVQDGEAGSETITYTRVPQPVH